MNKKIFAPLLGAVVLGLSAYAGYRTYDVYSAASETDLLMANVEALADGEDSSSKTGCDASSSCFCEISCTSCGIRIKGTGKATHTH